MRFLSFEVAINTGHSFLTLLIHVIWHILLPVTRVLAVLHLLSYPVDRFLFLSHSFPQLNGRRYRKKAQSISVKSPWIACRQLYHP